MRKKDAKHSKILYSFDIVILQDMNGVPEIIRRTSEGEYVWNQLRSMADFQQRFSRITNSDMWDELRRRYYNKKVKQMNGETDKKSFQLLNETVNEVISLFYK